MTVAFMIEQGTSTSTVKVIDTTSDEIISPTSGISTGSYSLGVAFTPDGATAFVVNDNFSNTSTSSISVIDTVSNTVLTTISLNSSYNPYCVAIGTIPSDGNTYAYVTYSKKSSSDDDVVLKVNTTSPWSHSELDLGATSLYPYGIAITPNGKYVYVANNGDGGSGSVSIITTNGNSVATHTFSSPNPNYPMCVAISPDSSTAYVTLDEGASNSGTVAYFAVGASVPGTITYVPVGKQPRGIAITPDGNTIYVANAGDNTVSYFAAGSSSASLVTDSGSSFNEPLGVAVTPDGTKVYVGNVNGSSGNGSISVIDTSTNHVTTVIYSTGGSSLGIFIQQDSSGGPFGGGACSDWFGC